MPLNQAQLMAVPGGPGVTGAVKGSSTVSVSADGTLSTSAKSILPTYKAGRYLYTDGDSLSWQEAGGSGGAITSLDAGDNIRIQAPSGPVPSIRVIDSPNFPGQVTIGSGLDVTGGGIVSRPGGSASDPGFKLSNPSGSFTGGLFLDVGSSAIGLSTNGTLVFKASTSETEITRALTVSGGGITCTPGGSAAIPGFRLQNPSGTEQGGLYLQTATNSIGLSYKGNSVLEASASETTIQRDLTVNGGQITIKNQGGGSAAKPAFFIQSPNSPGTNNGGMYLNPSTNVLGLAWNGSSILQGNGNQTTFFGDVTAQGKVTFQGGSFTNPGLRFASDLDTGIYQVGNGDSSQVGITCNGTSVATFDKGQILCSAKITFQGGSATAPGLRFVSDTNTGIYQVGNSANSVVGITADGQSIATFSIGDSAFNSKVTFRGGTGAAPGLRFASDLDTGIYQVGSGSTSELGITCDAIPVCSFKTNEVRFAPTAGLDVIQVFNNPLSSTNKVVINSSGQFGVNSSALAYVSGTGASPYGLDEILNLPASSYFSTISGVPAASPSIGLIAENVYSVMPLAVSEDESGNPYVVDMDAIVTTLVSAVQELNQNLLDLQTAFNDYVATHP